MCYSSNDILLMLVGCCKVIIMYFVEQCGPMEVTESEEGGGVTPADEYTRKGEESTPGPCCSEVGNG